MKSSLRIFLLWTLFFLLVGSLGESIMERMRDAEEARAIYFQIEKKENDQKILDLQREVKQLNGKKTPKMTLSKALALPLKSYRRALTQGYGQNLLAYGGMGLTGHPGVDYAVAEGTPVYAAHDGIVYVAYSCTIGQCVGYGRHVKIRARYGQQGEESVYAHLSKVSVAVGTYVTEGTLIGYSGDTGFSTRPHLHFGIRYLWYCDKGGTQVSKPCEVLNGDNGMMGWVDPMPQLAHTAG